MHHASKDTAAERIVLDGLDVKLEHLDGGYSVCFESHTADADLAALFRGLPDDRAQLPRWGYVLEGKVGFRFADREETYEAGDAYYVAPGHTPVHYAGAEIVEFSPTEILGETIPVVLRNLESARAAVGEPLMNYGLAYAIGFHPWEELAEHPPFAREAPGARRPRRRLESASVWGGARSGHRQRCLGRRARQAGLAGDRDRHRREGCSRRARERIQSERRRDAPRPRRRHRVARGRCGRSDSACSSTPAPSTGSATPSATAMGREVSAVAAPDATLILDCFAPRHRGPLPRGASRDDIERAFPDWEITDVDAADTDPDPVARLFRFEERFYRLRRSDDGAA